MDAKTLTDKFVKVQAYPQGTADVYLGDILIKTFGGVVAAAAANDMKNQLGSVIVQILREWDEGKLPDVVKMEGTEEKKEEKRTHFWP